MRRLFFFIILIALIAQVAAQITQSRYIMTIEINESGNALWTVEKRLPFTKTEITEWELFVKGGQNTSRYADISDLKVIINQFHDIAQNFSGRSMEVEEFNISHVSYDTEKTPSVAFGIIRYNFEWKNFSRHDATKIYIGDAFSEEQVLSSENIHIIEIPEGYEVQNATPNFDKRDGNRLVWEEAVYRNFSRGEPAIVLEREALVNFPVQRSLSSGGMNWGNILLFSAAMAVIFGIIVLISVIFWRRKHPTNESYEKSIKQMPAEMLHEILKIPGIWPKIVQAVHKELGMESVEELEKAAREHRLRSETSPQTGAENGAFIPTDEEIGYEQMIENYLAKSGGQAFQSDIVKESGLSKSKISIVLAEMKEKGRVIKIKKGKENIIRLVNS